MGLLLWADMNATNDGGAGVRGRSAICADKKPPSLRPPVAFSRRRRGDAPTLPCMTGCIFSLHILDGLKAQSFIHALCFDFDFIVLLHEELHKKPWL